MYTYTYEFLYIIDILYLSYFDVVNVRNNLRISFSSKVTSTLKCSKLNQKSKYLYNRFSSRNRFFRINDKRSKFSFFIKKCKYDRCDEKFKIFYKIVKGKTITYKNKKNQVYLKLKFAQIKTTKKLIFLSLLSKCRNRFEKMSNFKQRYH